MRMRYVLYFSFLLVLRHLFLSVFCQECVQETIEETTQECITLTLESAVSRALNYNRQLSDSFDAKVRSEYNVALAQSEFDIQFSPNSRVGYTGGGRDGTGIAVGGGLDMIKKFTTGTTVTLGPFVLKTPEHYQTDLRAMISQPLLRGFGREYQLSAIRGAEFALRTSCRSLYMAQLRLVVRTIKALYEVLKAHKSVELNYESHERIKKFYQAAKLKERVGLSDASDVYRAEIELNQAEDQLTSSQERFQEVEDDLRDLLALPLDTCLYVHVPLTYTNNILSETEAIKLAFQNRIEMEQAEDKWREEYRLSRILKNNCYPDINLVLDYTNCGRNEVFTRSCLGRRENRWGVGFTTRGDFDPLGEQIAYDQSLIAMNAAERGMEQTKADLTLEVKRHLRQLQRAYKRILLQDEQSRTAQGQLYLAQLKFNRGIANNFDVIQAEKSLRSAQLAYWSAIVDHIVGEYQLLATIGLLTDKPIIK